MREPLADTFAKHATSVYALGGNFTVPIGAPLHLVGGSIGV
jgi:hypothetical protein